MICCPSTKESNVIIGKVTANVVLESLMFYILLVIIFIEEGQLNITCG